MGGKAASLHVRTAALDGRASEGGGAEDETMGGRVIMGLTDIVTGFNTWGLYYEGNK